MEKTIKPKIAMLIMMAILLLSSVVEAQEQGITVDGQQCGQYCHSEIKYGSSSIKAIIEDSGKIILIDNRNQNTISLTGQKIIVAASISNTEYVASVVNSYYETNGDMIVEMCIDCTIPSFETTAKINKDGSVYLEHFTGVTYLLKGVVQENIKYFSLSFFPSLSFNLLALS